jgi:hypothetical protein
MADATGPSPEALGQAQLYSGLATGLNAGSRGQQQSVEVTGDPTGAAQAVSLPVTPATPALPETPRLNPTPTTLADLFQVGNIGAAGLPKPPVRRTA